MDRRQRIYILIGILALLCPCIMGVFSTAFFLGALGCLGAGIAWRVFRKRPVKSWAGLLLAVVVFSLGLSGADLWLRLFWWQNLYYRPHEMFIRRWPRLSDLSRYYPDCVYKGEVYGDLAAMSGSRESRQPRKVEFLTDRYGFRNRSVQKDVVFDVIALGDSFSMGSGTTQSSIWAEIIAKRYGLHCYNLSLPGSPWAQFVNLAVEKPRLKTHPKTVVVWTIFGGNDLDEFYGPLDLKELPWNGALGQAMVAYQTFRKRSPVQQLLKALRRSGRRKSKRVIHAKFLDDRQMMFYSYYTQRMERTYEDIRQHENYTQLVNTMNAMKRFVDAQKMKLVIATIPCKAEVYAWTLKQGRPWSTQGSPSGFHQAVEEIAKGQGIKIIDLKPYFLEAAAKEYQQNGDLLWWYDDTHWNTKGHRVAAEVIYKQLIQAP